MNRPTLTHNKIQLIKKYKGRWPILSIAKTVDLSMRDVRIIIDTLNLLNEIKKI